MVSNTTTGMSPNSSIYRDDGSKYSDYIADPSRYTKEEIATMVSVCKERFGDQFTVGHPFNDIRESKAILIFGKHIRSDEYRRALAGFPTVNQAAVVRLTLDGHSEEDIAATLKVSTVFVRSTLRNARRMNVDVAKDEWAVNGSLADRAATARMVLAQRRKKKREEVEKRINFLKSIPSNFGASLVEKVKGRHNLPKTKEPAAIGAELTTTARKKIEAADDARKRLEVAQEVITGKTPAGAGPSYKITPRQDGNFDMQLSNLSAIKMAEVLKVVG